MQMLEQADDFRALLLFWRADKSVK